MILTTEISTDTGKRERELERGREPFPERVSPEMHEGQPALHVRPIGLASSPNPVD
jgi:hypothetical protein